MFKKRLFTATIATSLALVMFAACGAPAAPGGAGEPAAPGQAAATPAEPAAPPAAVEHLDIVIGDLDSVVSADARGLNFTDSAWFDGRDFAPVADRLPTNPAIWYAVPTEHMQFEIGRHSPGPLRTIRWNPVRDNIPWTMGEQGLVQSPGRLGEEFLPNILESFEISDDLTTFTFTLREGMRWSDGHPVTTEDAYFAWHYWVTDTRIHPTTSAWHRAGGNPHNEVGTLDILDRYTFRMTFDGPYGGLIMRMAFASYYHYLQPAHVLSRLHIDLGDEEEIMQMVRDAGFTDAEWHVWFSYMRSSTWYTGRTNRLYPWFIPTLAPFVHVADSEPRIYQRNPYYWKVDSAGQQLPYIDYIHSFFVNDMSAGWIRILAGDIDHGYEFVPLNQLPFFAEHAEAGNMRVITTSTLHRTMADVLFNQTYECDDWRAVSQDVRFRRAISRAINRDEWMEVIYYGFARINDIQDPTFDFDYAMSLLDEMGMEFGPDGFRLAPSGNTFIIDLAIPVGNWTYEATGEILAEVLRELGLRVNARGVDSAFHTNMMNGNELQMTILFQHGPTQPTFDDWRFNASWRLWNQYRETQGAAGERPPEDAWQFMSDVFEIREVHPRDIPALRQRLHDSIAENYWSIIPFTDVVQVTMVNNDLRNIPEHGWMITGCFGGDAWWFDR